MPKSSIDDISSLSSRIAALEAGAQANPDASGAIEAQRKKEAEIKAKELADGTGDSNTQDN